MSTRASTAELSFLDELGVRGVSSGAAFGDFLETRGETIASHTPVDGSEIGRVRLASREDYEAVLARALAAFETWRMTPAPRRGEVVRVLGEEFRRRADAIPAASRHLSLYANSLTALNPLDEGVVTGDVVAALGVAAEPAAWRQRLEASAAAGVTEVVFQPAGPDIGRELEAFMAMASG